MQRSLPILVTLLLLPACHTPLLTLSSVVDPAREASLRQAHVPAIPARVHARAVLRYAGQENDLSLLFDARPPATLTVVAFDDLGGTLFQVKRTATATTLLRRTPLIPAGLITDGILEDLAVAFLAPPRTSLELRARPDGSTVMRADTPPHDVRYTDAPPLPHLASWTAGRQGRLERELQVHEWSAGDPHLVRLTVKNHIFDYQLILHVVEWHPLIP